MQAHEIKTALAVTQQHLTNATRIARGQPARLVYTDTTHRRKMRALLDGAGLAMVAFYKADWSLRYMLCEVCPGADSTARYVTVRDLELSEVSERPVHRRICLDTIAGVQAVFAPT